MKQDREKTSGKGIGQRVGQLADTMASAAAELTGKVRAAAGNSVDTMVQAVDQNGNGRIDIEDIIIAGLKTPGIGINRAEFLRKELFKRYSSEIVEDAVAHTPAHSGISVKEIDIIADEVIQYERTCVTGIATVLGVPSGAAMVATIPADILQYYGYMLRAAQKLLYLYGFPQIEVEEQGAHFDAETMNLLILCLGVMYGVAGANKALNAVAAALAKGVEKKLLQAALTKGTIYPFVKKTATWFGVNMTKQIFAGFFKKAIPVVGGVVGGGITYLSFKPCCEKLKDSLRETALTDPCQQDTGAAELVIEVMEEDLRPIQPEN